MGDGQRLASNEPQPNSQGVSGSSHAHAATYTIYSVGYERRTADELIALLLSYKIEALVDVRLNAVSRKKGLSKTALRQAAEDAGITYSHERGLGNPKDNRDAFRQGSNAARKRYLHHIRNGASGVYERVIQEARHKPTALLCYERDHNECHRSCILDSAEKSHGVTVEPIS